MKKLFILGLLALFASSTPARAQTFTVDGYAAVVNDRIITASDVRLLIVGLEQNLRRLHTGKELNDKLGEAFKQGLTRLIEQALILEEYESSEAALPEQVVDSRIKEIVNRNFDGNQAAFLDTLGADSITLEDYRNQIRDQIVISILQRQEIVDRASVSPKQVQERYAARRSEFLTEATAHLSIISIKPAASEEAAKEQMDKLLKIRQSLATGSDFANAARTISKDARAKDGGDYGVMKMSSLRKELAAAVDETPVGEVSEVVDTGDQIYIVKVQAKTAESEKPLGDVQDEIEQELLRQEEQRLFKAWIARLREKFHVKIY